MAPELRERTADGRLRVHFHAGQLAAWRSTARQTLILAGTQSGKTSFGPHWLHRTIQTRGPGDYSVVAPTYRLLELKALPEFRTVFEDLLALGSYKTSPIPRFEFSPGGLRRTFGPADATGKTTVFFGHAANPESLEAATFSGLWADEPGQKGFRLGSYEALQRRCAVKVAPQLYTTTPYDLGWLKTKLYDRGVAGDPDVAVISFASTMNPAFPPAELERARAQLPAWRFRMFYLGQFARPAGLIYDCFSRARHTCRRFPVPPSWPRYWGVDFGGVHTAVLCLAEDPATRRLYVTREYLAGGRTAREHAAVLLAAGTPAAEPPPRRVAGGAKSEGQWRAEFAAAGLPMEAPDVHAVEVGIQRVYGTFAADELLIFDDLEGTLDQLDSYSRETDALGQPTEAIAAKETYHFLDALRYIVSRLRPGGLPEDADAPMPEVYA